MKTVALLTVVVSFFLAGSLLVGAVQNSLKAQKALTPEQLRAQREFAESQSEADRLRAQAKQAFSAEIARAARQGGDCPQAKTTYEEVRCLEREAGQTEANYKAAATALRAL